MNYWGIFFMSATTIFLLGAACFGWVLETKKRALERAVNKISGCPHYSR